MSDKEDEARRRELRGRAAMARIRVTMLFERLAADHEQREKERYRKLVRVRALLKRRKIIREARALVGLPPHNYCTKRSSAHVVDAVITLFTALPEYPEQTGE